MLVVLPTSQGVGHGDQIDPADLLDRRRKEEIRFQKKSTQGVKTPKHEVDLIEDRLKRLKEALR